MLRLIHCVPRWRLGLLLVGLMLALEVRGEEKLEYNRDIRPILAENCFNCHGPDSASRKGSLRLDQREAAIQAEAIIPHDIEKSALIERIMTMTAKQLMPPAKTQKKLTAEQKDKLRRWIASGAEYQAHWSFLAPKRPELPKVKDAAWARNPIDHFILATLEKHNLKPATEADRRTLARRLSLDLVGLPPEPADVERFMKDSAPDAYERYVDRLFESPHYGEHRARYWLDAARYADTHGIHFDNFREMWSYRDWVINAYNKNVPFDQFTIEQLAGDLLPNRTLDQQVATGFNRCNITTNEGGAINDEYLVLYTRDRVETVSQVWLGLTAGCSTCHNHKFDPLSQREFYELAAFFNNTTQGAMDGNIKDTPPIVLVPRADDRPRYDALKSDLTQLKKQVAERRAATEPEFQKWLKTSDHAEIMTHIPSTGLNFYASLSEGEGKKIQAVVDGQTREVELGKGVWDVGHVSDKAFKSSAAGVVSIQEAGDFDKNQPFSYSAWVKLPKRGITGAVFARMDEKREHRGWDLWLEDNRFGTHIINQWPQNALKVTGQTQMQPNQWYHLMVTYDGSGKASGVRLFLNGNPEAFQVFTDKLQGTIRAEVPFKIAQRDQQAVVDKLAVQEVRLYARELTPLEVNRVAKTRRVAHLARKVKGRSQAEQNEMNDWFMMVDKGYQSLGEQISKLEREETSIKARGTIAHVMQEKAADPIAHILFRGEYDQKRDQVKAGTPNFLPPFPNDLPKNRLGFAQWLLRPEHPLTARVNVNRFWQEFFGTGIVRSSGDFGGSGEMPSHPELLDWLAVDFRESGWDVKRMLKMIVTSATYRQSANTTPEKLERDPQNRLLSRGSHYRLDAEMIRDYALASSGSLVRKIGGPSVKPYQPEGVWEAVGMIGSNTREYRQDTGENLYRRSMYTFWKRAAPPASLETLNAPNRETCAVRRERTNTPLQALVTLNDPQFVEAARFLAQKTLKEGSEKAEAKLEFMAQRVLARSFSPEELQVVQGELNDLLTHYQKHGDEARKLITVGESRPDPALDVPTLAAWTMLANSMLNLDEVLNK